MSCHWWKWHKDTSIPIFLYDKSMGYLKMWLSWGWWEIYFDVSINPRTGGGISTPPPEVFVDSVKAAALSWHLSSKKYVSWRDLTRELRWWHHFGSTAMAVLYFELAMPRMHSAGHIYAPKTKTQLHGRWLLRPLHFAEILNLNAKRCDSWRLTRLLFSQSSSSIRGETEGGRTPRPVSYPSVCKEPLGRAIFKGNCSPSEIHIFY